MDEKPPGHAGNFIFWAGYLALILFLYAGLLAEFLSEKFP